MAIASLVISVVSLLVAGWLGLRSLVHAKRSADAAQRSAVAAEGSRAAADAQAQATATQAAAARDQLAIERERFHQEQTPILEGSIKPRPGWRGGPEDKDHILEVRVRDNRTLATLLLHLPLGAYVGRSKGLLGPSGQVFGYPEVGKATISPGNPAIWDIAVGAETPDSFTARADCRDENGQQWVDVEVPITRES